MRRSLPFRKFGNGAFARFLNGGAHGLSGTTKANLLGNGHLGGVDSMNEVHAVLISKGSVELTLVGHIGSGNRCRREDLGEIARQFLSGRLGLGETGPPFERYNVASSAAIS